MIFNDKNDKDNKTISRYNLDIAFSDEVELFSSSWWRRWWPPPGAPRCVKTNVTSLHPLTFSQSSDCDFQLSEVSSWVITITQTQVNPAEQDCFNCYQQDRAPAAILSSVWWLLQYLSSLTKSLVCILPLTLSPQPRDAVKRCFMLEFLNETFITQQKTDASRDPW